MGSRKWTAVILVAVLVITGSLTTFAWAQDAQGEKRAEPTGGEVAAAVASNVFYAPGKFFRCVGGGVLWIVAMGVTFGTAYDDAARMISSACGGKWTLDDADMRRATEPMGRK